MLGERIRTQCGFQFILVVTDRCMNLFKAIPLNGISATEVTKSFVDHSVFNFGPPSELVSDNGRQFTSRFFQDDCHILKIHYSFTTTYHSQNNAHAERLNRTSLAAIRSYTNYGPSDWYLYTTALNYTNNGQTQTSTTLALFEVFCSKAPGPITPDLPPLKYARNASFTEKGEDLTCQSHL